MPSPEFSRIVQRQRVPSQGQADHLVATDAERQALARRFGLLSVDRLEAHLRTTPSDTGLRASGTLDAEVILTCAVSGQPLARRLSLPVAFIFEPDGPDPGAEVELDAEALDILPLEAGRADLGEAVAQSLFLALDPYDRAPDADLVEARRLLMSEDEAAELARSDRPNPFRSLRTS